MMELYKKQSLIQQTTISSRESFASLQNSLSQPPNINEKDRHTHFTENTRIRAGKYPMLRQTSSFMHLPAIDPWEKQEDLLNKYRAEIQGIHKEIVRQTKSKLDWLRDQVDCQEEKIEEALQKFGCIEELKKTDFSDTWDLVKSIRHNTINNINYFYEDYMSQQKNYVREMERSIKYHAGENRRMESQVPIDIFEKQIFEINLSITSNTRSVSDLCLHLKQLQHSKLLALNNTLAHKLERWIRTREEQFLVQRRTRSAGKQQSIRKAPDLRKISERKLKQNLVFSTILIDNPKLLSLLKTILDENRDDYKQADWVGKIQHTDKKTYDNIKQLVTAYWTLVEHIHTIAPLIIESADAICSQNEKIKRSSSLEIMRSGSIQFDVSKSTLGDNEQVQELLEQFTSIHSCIMFMHDSKELWETYVNSLEKLKRLATTCLRKLSENQDEKRKRRDIEMIQTVALLRMENNKDGLDVQLKEIVRQTDMCKDVIKQDSNDILNFTRKLFSVASEAGRNVSKTITALLDYYPKPEKILYLEGSATVLTDIQIEVPKPLLNCKYHLNALRNWLFAFTKEMDSYSYKCDLDISNRLEIWLAEGGYGPAESVDEFIKRLGRQISRIVELVYKVRLSETKIHNLLLESHKAAVEKIVNQLQDEFKDFNFRIKENMTAFNDKYNSKLETSKALSMAELQVTVHTASKEVTKINPTLENAFRNFEKHIRSTFSFVSESQKLFLRKIKLFSEGGNFNATEMLAFESELSNISKFTNSKQSLFLKDLDKNSKAIMKEYKSVPSKIFAPLNFLLKKAEFNEKVKKLSTETREFVNKLTQNVLKTDTSLFSEIRKNLLELLTEYTRTPSKLLVASFDNMLVNINDRITYLKAPIQTNKYLKGKYNLKKETNLDFFKHISKLNLGKSKVTDYKKIFGTPSNKFDLQSEISMKLYENLSEIQELAIELYYESVPNAPKKNGDHKEFYEFMENICWTLLDYYSRCLEINKTERTELRKWIYRLTSAVNLYVFKKLIQFQTSKLQLLSEFSNKFNSEKELILSQDRKQREQFYNKLRAVYGFPSNSSLLDECEKSVINACHALEVNVRNFVLRSKENLNSIVSKYILHINFISSNLKRFEDQCLKSELYDFIKTDSEIVLENLEGENFGEHSDTSVSQMSAYNVQTGTCDFLKLYSTNPSREDFPKLVDCTKNCVTVFINQIGNASIERSNEQDNCFKADAVYCLNTTIITGKFQLVFMQEVEVLSEVIDFLNVYKKYSVDWLNKWTQYKNSVKIQCT